MTSGSGNPGIDASSETGGKSPALTEEIRAMVQPTVNNKRETDMAGPSVRRF
jgi:hypothetical protein